MTDIKDLALRVATETHAAQETFDLWNPDIQAGKVQKFIVDFAQRFLAAYLAEQEPVATLHDDGYWTLAKNAPSDLGPKSQRAGWRMDVFAAPPLPEPTPQQQNSKSKSGEKRQPPHCEGESSGKPAVGAAPSQKEVREMVWCVTGEGCSTEEPIYGESLDAAIDATMKTPNAELTARPKAVAGSTPGAAAKEGP